VARLSIAEQQIVEIAKALSLRSRLVILDEPTSSLPLAETDKLLEVIAGLKADGISVIFISHRLHEVVEASDRVVVLRDGRLVGTLEGADINHDAMVRLMVGRTSRDYVPPSKPRGDVVVSVRGCGPRPIRPMTSTSMAAILGLAGLVGAGRELARCCSASTARPAAASLNGRAAQFATSSDAVAAGSSSCRRTGRAPA
jgi:ribose transport system ATP-binding protein